MNGSPSANPTALEISRPFFASSLLHRLQPKLHLLVCCFGGLLLLTSGCKMLEKHLAESEQCFLSGQYQAGIDAIPEPAEATSEALLPNLYRSSNHLMSAQYDLCLNDLILAEGGLDEQDESINWFNDYYARTYDGLMVYTYRALMYLILGKAEDARVAFNRLEECQGAASRRSEKFITKAQQDVASERSNPKNSSALSYLDKTNSDADNQEKLNKYQHLLDHWEPYADYQSPIGRFLSGTFRLFYLADPNDADKACFQLKSAYGMTNSEVAMALYELADMRADGQIGEEDIANYVVVVFENGMGCVKEEVRYELEVPYIEPIYVGIALPTLVEQEAAYPYLALTDGIQRIGVTSPLCDMDRLIVTEFQKELPSIIAKEVSSAVIKVALQIVAIEVTRRKFGDLAAMVVSMVGSYLSDFTTNADVRGWNLLPKEYQVALVQRPASGLLGIATPNSSLPFTEVELPPGPAIVYLKIPVTGLPALVTVMGPNMESDNAQ
ncbi:MAG: hypothetical protein IKS83_09240 [Victivallales bacterium]|nr:hypothetical protein [Victivallales bacterium]